MKQNFMYWNATNSAVPASGSLNLPFPDFNSNEFVTTENYRTQNAADGSIVGQKVGRGKVSMSLNWGILPTATWWNIGAWTTANGNVFYCKYFDNNTGIWLIKKMMLTERKATPYRPHSIATDNNWGQPKYYRNCKITLVDLGM